MERTAVDPGHPMPLATRILVGVIALDAALVAGTGVWLARFYRPTVAAGRPIGATQVLTVDWVRFAHRWTAAALIGLAVVWLVLAVVRLGRRASTGAVVATGLSLAGVGALAGGWITGWLLPWDQLALWAVRVGTDMSGYRFLRSNDVRFVILGGREIGLDQLQRAFLLHAVVIPFTLALVALGLWWTHVRRGRDVAANQADDAAVVESADSAWRA